MKMKIGELANISGCQVVTIRFYEKKGLLSKTERTESNYRLYSDMDIERLRFIRHCRRHGMKLPEIRKLLAFKDNPDSGCGWINTLIETHIGDVVEQINSLTLLKEELQSLLYKCSGDEESCGILKSLDSVDGCPYCENLMIKKAKRLPPLG